MGIKEFNNAKQQSKIVASLDIEGHTKKELSRYNSKIRRRPKVGGELTTDLPAFYLEI